MGQKNINGDLNVTGAIKHNGTEISYSAGMQNPMTTAGDMIYGDAQGKPERLPRANVGDILKMGRVNGVYKPVWGEDNYLEIYETSAQDIEDLVDNVYTFTNDFKDIVTSLRYALLIDGSLLGSSGTFLLYPCSDQNIIEQLYNYSTPPFHSDGVPLFISAVFYIDSTTNKLCMSTLPPNGVTPIQKDLYWNPLQDGTIDKVIGYNSGGNLVKGTVSGGGGVQDLTSNTAVTINSTDWATLKTNHSLIMASPTMTGLDSTYEFVNIKMSINSNNEYVKLNKNTTNKYSGLFFIEESTNVFEITVYYNGTNMILRCATVM